MPFSSGTFALYTPGNPVVSGTTISSTWAQNTLNDIATGLSTCLLKDGSQTVTANIPMSTFKLTGLGAGTAAGNSVRWEQASVGVVTTKGDLAPATGSGAIARLAAGANGTALVADSSQTTGLNYVPTPIALTGAAGTNTVTATSAPAITAYATGQQFFLIPANTNTGATTLNVSGLGAKNVFLSASACVGNELTANVPALLEYDGTQFQIVANGAGSMLYASSTWTPIDGSGATLSFSSVNGYYVKIGRLVMINATLTYPATADGSAAIIGGFPFTIANSTGNAPVGGTMTTGAATAPVVIVGTAGAGSGGLRLSNGTNITNTNMSGATLRFSLMFFV